MKDSRVGTFALVGMSLVLYTKLRLLEHILTHGSAEKVCVDGREAP
jgi:cobalamin synthase